MEDLASGWTYHDWLKWLHKKVKGERVWMCNLLLIRLRKDSVHLDYAPHLWFSALTHTKFENVSFPVKVWSLLSDIEGWSWMIHSVRYVTSSGHSLCFSLWFSIAKDENWTQEVWSCFSPPTWNWNHIFLGAVMLLHCLASMLISRISWKCLPTKYNYSLSSECVSGTVLGLLFFHLHWAKT